MEDKFQRGLLFVMTIFIVISFLLDLGNGEPSDVPASPLFVFNS